MVKNPPANAGEMVDTSSIPGGENLLEEGMATYFRILAWRIPWTEKTGGLQSLGRKESDMTERLGTPRLIHGILVYPFSLQSV